MTLDMFLMRELVITNSIEIQEKAETELQSLYQYEKNKRLLETSSKGVYKRYRQLTEKLNSEKFCAIILEGNSE
jgi:hypothetical protein